MKSSMIRFGNKATLIISQVIKLRIAPDELTLFFRDTPVYYSSDCDGVIIGRNEDGETVIKIGKYRLVINIHDLNLALAYVSKGSVTTALTKRLRCIVKLNKDYL